MLDATLKSQLKTYLERVTQPIEIVASLDDGAKSRELHDLLVEIASLSNLITFSADGTDARRPSFSLNRPGADISLRFASTSPWATSSHRWCWHCCKWVATRQRPVPK